MECLWDAALLQRSSELPPELLHAIKNADNNQYLSAITRASLDPKYIYLLFAHCENIFAHISAEVRTHGDLPTSIATLGRIVPFAPQLAPYASQLLDSESYFFNSSQSENGDLSYLLGLFRLLSFDHRAFSRHVSPADITALLASPSRSVVYMAIRILQIYLGGADHWFEEMFNRHLGPDTSENGIFGTWDDKTIDFRFLTLWEETRHEKLNALKEQVNSELTGLTGNPRLIPEDMFHPSTALVGGVLLPRANFHESASHLPDASLVKCPTITGNLQKMASALKSSEPMLLTGLAGSGKTLLVRHVAERLGKLDKMVTLHLNEQSDAKLLIGLYTTGDTPGTFLWRPGVLTTAVQEGRWIFIEDLDRAPNDIIGTLLPLIEKRVLLIPNRKQTIHAAQGFRIVATARSTLNHRGDEIRPLVHMIGARHWRHISIDMPHSTEQKDIAEQLFPSLEPLLPQFMATYDRLQSSRLSNAVTGQSNAGVVRALSPRDLLKWCSRVTNLLRQRTSLTSADVDDMFMEAVDSFIGAIPDGPARTHMASIIAEELRIDPQRRDFLLTERDVRYEASKTKIGVGRYTLPCSQKSSRPLQSQSSFSTNPHTSRMLERVAAAVINREPLLLVGETGVGKTTAVQHLATHLGKKLEAFNLSQQSEAGDLLGGFKPVTARSLVIPMNDEFDELFRASFSMTKNQQFLELLAKQMAKGNWKAVCKLWRQALKMVDQQRANSPARDGQAPSKRRKVEGAKIPDFGRWDSFAAKTESVEKRLTAGSDAFAFSFVEGNIVKALRNGDWVLLDEINLASSDTLEAIVDLLDAKAPSLLLTEAGNIERIQAHPEFRVFAAMNPATDVGKKDLPPGVRSRFTELYVESPDKDIKSLQSIVQSYLRSEAASDQAIALDVSVLYQKIIGLAEQNKLVDGAGQKPHFSLRTLTRTLSYAKYIAQQCNLRRALFEGFQMSFLTFLDIESAKLVQPLLEQQLFGKRINVRAELRKSLRKPNDGHEHVQGFPDSKHWVRQGTFQTLDEPHYILTPFIKNNLENLVRAASTRKFPVLIQGPTSSGKTSMIEYLAKRTGHKFVRINNHEHTDLQEYLGTYVSGADGRLQFQEGVLVQALREGHWIVLDELNLAPTDVLEALNRLLDDNRELLIPETQEVVRPHESFMLFATQNPAGLYGGRKTLSRAFRNRFLELHFDDIPVDELQEILHRRTQLPESRCKRIVSIYRELSVLRQENRLFEQKSFATLRDLFRWALRPNDTIEDLAANGFMLLAERVRKPEERQALKDVIEKAMSAKGPKVTIDENLLYSATSNEIQKYRANAQSAGVVWTRAMRRLYVLVSRAIANNEPVLLVGETGCGKTTVCQMLAEAFHKDLHTVNAHQNTETGDLIGSQRPVRNRAFIEAQLREQLLSSPLIRSLETAAAHSTDALLEMYDQALQSLDGPAQQVHSESHGHLEIQSYRTRFKALFEWVDGSLVQAMKEGAFFLLDEISLADDSVLERINSVLESHRSILLAEKGSLDSFVTAAPEYEFFATMNPGGDYGKRELSPALRNRFTEIWVPSLSETDDIIQIVQDKLSRGAKSYAPAMVAFAKWFKDQYNTSATSSVSIRDILAWVLFVNESLSLRNTAAIVHGAAMVYIDTLGANPAGLMTLTGRSLDQERAACVAQLGELIDTDASTTYSAPMTITATIDSFQIGPFAVMRKWNTELLPTAFTFDPATSRSNAMRVLRAMQIPKPVMLEGSPGVGKTALVTAIANAAAVPLTRINLSEQTDLLDLFGSDVPVEGAATGVFTWRDAPFLRAMKNGEWVLLDEMNLASQSVLEGLNACLDHRGEVFVPELGQTFTRHPEFRLFAAQNPHHQGGGRKGLPASFVNRFTVVYADAFRFDDLMLICQRSFPQIDNKTIEQAVRFVDKLELEVVQRRSFGANGGPWEFNLRDVSRWMTLLCSDRDLLLAGTASDFVEFLFSQRFRSSADTTRANNLMSSLWDPVPPASDLFSSISQQSLQLGLALLPRDSLKADSPVTTSWSPRSSQQLKVLQSVMLCVQNKWPVILTGPSGAGKTSLLESLASATGASLSTMAMNAETDAMDLIGGYEQADAQRQVGEAIGDLQAHCHRAVKLGLLENQISDANELFECLHRLGKVGVAPSDMIGQLEELLAPIRSPDIDRLLETVRTASQTIEKARFDWIDGLLVEALQRGDWLILDNANLCSSSVLDRLNSLLEPNGSLIINEHTEADGAPRILQPHANFRIFLTVDPRYGELSRAMRNRAAELYLPYEEDNDLCLTPLATESATSRFGQAKALRGPVATDGSAAQKIAVFCDHLGLMDQPLFSRMKQQLQDGLFDGLSADVLFALAAYEESSARPPSFLNDLEQLYSTPICHMQVPVDFVYAQTLHPLNNQALAQASQQTFSKASIQAFVSETFSILAPIVKALRSLGPNNPITKRVQRVERSVFAKARGSAKTNPQSLSILSLLETLLTLTVHWTRTLDDTGLSKLTTAVRHVCTLWWCLFEAACTADFNQALFNAWLSATRNTVQSLNFHDQPPLSALASSVQQTLKSFEFTARTIAGRGCTPMWKVLRSPIPSTTEALSNLLEFEKVAQRFDELAGAFNLPLQALVDLRFSFTRALDLAQRGNANTQELALKLESLLQDNTSSQAKLATPNVLFFDKIFESICQQFSIKSLNGSVVAPRDVTMWEILAKRKSIHSFAILSLYDGPESHHRQLKLLSAAMPSANSESDDPSEGLNFVQSLFQRLNSIGLASIGSLKLFEDESSELAKAVASNTHLLCASDQLALDVCLEHLVVSVLNALASNTDHDGIQAQATTLLGSLQGDISNAGFDSPPHNAHTVDGGLQSGIQWVNTQFITVIRYLQHAKDDQEKTTLEASHAWSTFALLCLTLYLPEEPFDPALEPRLIQSMHRHSVNELSTMQQDLQSFRKALTGEASSLRVRLLSDQINNLGPEPPIDEVCRPQVSELPELQGEFESLARVTRSLQRSNNVTRDSSSLRETWTNIESMRERMATRYRSYGDLTGPVVGFIDCLRIARRLELQCGTPENRVSVASTTPFAKGSASVWAADESFIESLDNSRGIEEKLDSLSVLAARCSTWNLKETSQDLRTAVEREFFQIFQKWQSELTEDQRKTAAKSSLYRYQGDEDTKDEDADEYIEELFPTVQNDGHMPEQTQMLGQKFVSMTPKITAVHRSLFSPVSSTTSWSDLLQNLASNTLLNASGGETAPLVSKMILSLKDLVNNQSHATQTGRSYNMYTDANVEQVKVLSKLIHKIMQRFDTLHAAWPEHATPIEVFRACEQIWSIGQYEPLTKLLQHLEKLHATVAEWQKIASREFSANEVYDDLTTLIVNWRQLELSSWAGLLDREDENCQRDAASWWFVAYENIIVATHDLRDSAAGLQSHAEGLLKTLEIFIANCGLGEFAPRIQVLTDFKDHLTTSCIDYPSLQVVCDAVANFIAYHKHFATPIAETLAKGRSNLEKEIMNVVKVASWKDRNVEVLRQSAKSSHKKLLRLIRKYRRILAQPVGPTLQAGIPRKSLQSTELPSVFAANDVVDQGAIDDVSQAIESWTGRPDRFKNIATTSTLMRSKVARNLAATDVPSKLATFTTELSSSISELQKATPSTLTEKNKKLVQHLKTRKRRLLADVLKEVRSMGFQSNLSDDVLAQQAALAAILARSSAIDQNSGVQGSDVSEYHFHQLLDIMPTVRESARKHSEDLTPAETARCLALLESMLHVCVDQRSQFCEITKTSKQLHQTVKLFGAFSDCPSPVTPPSNEPGLQVLSLEVRHLAAALTTCSEVIQAQAQLSFKDPKDTLQPLNQLQNELFNLANAISAESSLPSGIQTISSLNHRLEYQRICDEVLSFIPRASQTCPEYVHVLSQLSKWANNDTDGISSRKGDHMDVTGTTWTTELLSTLDQILGSVQRLEEVGSESLAAADDKAWLLRSQTTMNRQLAVLRATEVSHSLQALLISLPNLKTERGDLLASIATVCRSVKPIFSTFSATHDHIISSINSTLSETSKLAFNLATSFVQLAQKGFCTPGEKSDTNEQSAGDVEAGTGLGDGEGGEDISKDIKDDEDLSELAQQQQSGEEEKEDIEDEKDAVDMADAEMEGQMGDEGEGSESGDEGSDAGKEEMDEEAGDVDDLGSNTIDEKMWDEGKDEDLRDKETDQSKGTGKDDDMTGADQTEDDAEPEKNDEQETDEMGAAADETEEVNQQEVEKIDPHVQEQDNLDLPDDLNAEGGDGDETLDNDDADLGGLSDTEMDEDRPGENTSEQGDEEHAEPEEADVEPGEDEEPSDGNEDLAEAGPEQEGEGDDDAKSDVLMGEGTEADNETKPDDDVFGETGNGPEQDESRTKPSEPAAAGQDGEMQEEPVDTDPDSGTSGGRSKLQGEDQGAQNNSDEDSRVPYKQIGDALDEWFRQNQPLEAAQQREEKSQEKPEDIDVAQAQFEHLPNEDAEADTQALGTASADQSTALDESKGLPVNEQEDSNNAPFDATPKEEDAHDDDTAADMANQAPDATDSAGQDNVSKAFVGESKSNNVDHDMEDARSESDDDNVDEVDEQLLNTHISHDDVPEEISIHEARALWAEHEASTRNSALVLTEHLRLILQPTQATKMRGDFRTGKRLNIKRIIPYIASSYKRDKIWMRRSVPSKRSYQIMLAIDDSKSMAESESRNLAFETLALISKSMSMLEVGELGVVGFGENVKVAHDFSSPFNSDTGAEVFRQFAFSQTKTNVRKLLSESIELFRAARLKATGAASELWQLQLIISDGICEDHPSIRQLVRQAHEERIMVVFIIVDSAAEPSQPAGAPPPQSIIDLQSAEFAKDANGEMQLNMVKYLDTFPFRYYLIVREVQELPAVLAGALRQWFSEVVDTA